MTKAISNETLTQQVRVSSDIYTGSHIISTMQESYQLTEAKFEYLMNGKPEIYSYASAILLTTIGFGLSILSKVISDFSGSKNANEVGVGDWYALAIGFCISIIFWLIGRFCLDDKRKRVKKEIEEHFKNAPVQQVISKGEGR